MKYIAFYFPQFHRIEENDEWWGAGFTDWQLVQRSVSNEKEQYQPRVPLNSNYYDLSREESISWQVDLAERYKLDGFNFYHYWFDGKLILEKPMELFLKNKNHNLSYCITWANETWTKQWIGSSEVLIKQKHLYDKRLWEEHFDYLLQFFDDDRYIKIDNKPVFCVYRPELNKHMSEYIDFFNQQALENGFDGIYFIGMKSYDFEGEKDVYKKFNAKMFFQPRYLFNKVFFRKSLIMSIIERKMRALPEKMQLFIGKNKFLIEKSKKIDYNSFGLNLIKLAKETNDKTYQSIIVDWDNTARYSKRSKFFYNVSPKIFEKYLMELSVIEKEKENEFIFINAWNEWSEGAYLEPDERNKYGYLDIIRRIKSL